jgi:hypothetical protein
MSIERKGKIIKNIKATMAVEGQHLTKMNKIILADYLDNKITKKAAIAKIKKSIFR